MASIGLKLFYLRTRVKRISQQRLADAIGVRQATLSNIERGNSLPTCPLLLELSKFFDVTPTFLLDAERGLTPGPIDRWSARDNLVTSGMWIELPKDSVVETADGKLLCPLLPGEAFYDDEARRLREDAAGLAKLRRSRRQSDEGLTAILEGELKKHPQRRSRS